MRNIMWKKVVSMLVIALFIAAFSGAAVSQETEESIIIKGTIISINAVSTGNVIVVQIESDKMENLTAGLEIDLKNFNVGDKVVIECSSERVIQSIAKKEA